MQAGSCSDGRPIGGYSHIATRMEDYLAFGLYTTLRHPVLRGGQWCLTQTQVLPTDDWSHFIRQSGGLRVSQNNSQSCVCRELTGRVIILIVTRHRWWYNGTGSTSTKWSIFRRDAETMHKLLMRLAPGLC